MNCNYWEEQVALHAENDLPLTDRAAAERHLAECAACRQFLEELKQSLAALRAAHAEPLDASAFTAVRARVLDRIDRARRRPPSWLGWIGALAAAATVLITLLLPRPVPPPNLVAPPQPVLAPPAPVIAPAPKAVSGRKRKSATRPEPLMVKLITDDPNVVIYWITN